MGFDSDSASGARAEGGAAPRARPTLLLEAAETYELAPIPPGPTEHDHAEREREHVDRELDRNGSRVRPAVDAVLQIEQHVEQAEVDARRAAGDAPEQGAPSTSRERDARPDARHYDPGVGERERVLERIVRLG